MRFNFLIGLALLIGLNANGVLAQHRTVVSFRDTPADGKLEKQVSSFLTELNLAESENRNPSFQRLNLSPAARTAMKELWSYRRFFCPDPSLILTPVNRSDSSIELRDIPVLIRVSADSVLSESLVLTYSKSNQLQSVQFGLELHQVQAVLSGGETVTDIRRRQQILDFVESFRTAYNRKDLPYLSQVFSDQALIIVGHVIRVGDDNSAFLESNLGIERVELIRQSKTEYLDGLAGVFKSNDYIKVGFEEIEVVRHRKFQTIYGVSLLQYWYSPRYSDKGYLFLMIDFRNELQPMIHVRSWQPEKFTDRDSVISLGDFDIIE